MNFIFLPVQLLITLFLLFAASRAYLRFKEGTIHFGAFLFWMGLWILAIFSVFNPQFTSYVADLLGIGRGADVIIYLSIALLFYLIFRTNVLIENLRDQITQLTTKIALKKEESEQRENKKN